MLFSAATDLSWRSVDVINVREPSWRGETHRLKMRMIDYVMQITTLSGQLETYKSYVCKNCGE
jgi:hypothetical protein